MTTSSLLPRTAYHDLDPQCGQGWETQEPSLWQHSGAGPWLSFCCHITCFFLLCSRFLIMLFYILYIYIYREREREINAILVFCLGCSYTLSWSFSFKNVPYLYCFSHITDLATSSFITLPSHGASQATLVVKNPPANARDIKMQVDPWVGKTSHSNF